MAKSIVQPLPPGFLIVPPMNAGEALHQAADLIGLANWMSQARTIIQATLDAQAANEEFAGQLELHAIYPENFWHSGHDRGLNILNDYACTLLRLAKETKEANHG